MSRITNRKFIASMFEYVLVLIFTLWRNYPFFSLLRIFLFLASNMFLDIEPYVHQRDNIKM